MGVKNPVNVETEELKRHKGIRLNLGFTRQMILKKNNKSNTG